jgi:peptidoglycan/xylan/chitin deacetylase (PgdA/CDA1 family)
MMIILITSIITLSKTNSFHELAKASSKPNVHMPKIAFVQSTFTDAAYNNAFYLFYSKYNSLYILSNVTTDLNLLTAVIPDDTSPKSSRIYVNRLVDALRPVLSNAPPMSVLKDQDIDSGSIFFTNGTNIYDVLVLGHEEYVTQKEYTNFKRFVSNGGTIIFINGNMFYGEVNYNKNNNTVTLVKGHSWEYDVIKNVATRSTINERWFDENREWIGSNTWLSPQELKVYFDKNPFNYAHFEENYVNSPKDKIILDYKAIDPRYKQSSTIATYELNYNKGKVLVLGVYGYAILDNDKFIQFLEQLLLNQPISKEAYSQTNYCRCVAFKVDDIQDYYVNNTQIAIIDLFQKKNASFTAGFIAGKFGNDTPFVAHIMQVLHDNKHPDKRKQPLLEVASEGWNYDNFTQLAESQQSAIIRKSNEKISLTLRVTPPTVFIPPMRSFDNNTLQALHENDFRTISSAVKFDPPPYHFHNVTLFHFPQTISIGNYIVGKPSRSVEQIYSEIQYSLVKYGFAVIWIHPTAFSKRPTMSNEKDEVDWQQIKQLDLLIDKIRGQGTDIVKISEINRYPKIP